MACGDPLNLDTPLVGGICKMAGRDKPLLVASEDSATTVTAGDFQSDVNGINTAFTVAVEIVLSSILWVNPRKYQVYSTGMWWTPLAIADVGTYFGGQN